MPARLPAACRLLLPSLCPPAAARHQGNEKSYNEDVLAGVARCAAGTTGTSTGGALALARARLQVLR